MHNVDHLRKELEYKLNRKRPINKALYNNVKQVIKILENGFHIEPYDLSLKDDGTISVVYSNRGICININDHGPYSIEKVYKDRFVFMPDIVDFNFDNLKSCIEWIIEPLMS